MPKSRIATVVLLASLMFVTRWISAQENASEGNAQKSKSQLKLEVTDEFGAPIRGAEIEVLKWTGKLESIGVTGSTDGEGNVVLDVPYSDDNFYLKLACKGYATGQRALRLSPGELKKQLQTKSPCAELDQIDCGR